jgi:triosephosphate isomerase
MHQRPVLAANWKMNHGPTEAVAVVKAYLDRHPVRTDRTVVFFPPSISFSAVKGALRARPDIRLGVQNVHTEEKGAFTGEISAAMAADAGAAFVLVGHSERRHVFHETDAQVAQKCARVVQHGLVPLLCVGETLAQRERGETTEIVLHQLRTGVSMLSHEGIRNLIVAYEPVWAIGTGRTASPEDATLVHGLIRSALAEMIGAGAAEEVPIVYGGSVNPANAPALLSAPEIDGVLVGGASLDPVGWAETCNCP